MLHDTESDRQYLKRLGDEVRRLRRDIGLNRKLLAERSGVSERFLAQLETGEGNISIVRLRHVAFAIGCSVHKLLESIEPPDAGAASGRIALIGLRGAGKTTLGELAAARLNRPFIELTDRIERSSGLSLSDIFNLYGTEGYRRLEQRELNRVVEQYDDCILAAGGGVSENREAFETLLSKFRTVWLTAAPDEHLSRVVDQGDMRPFEGHNEALLELKAILGNRAHEYARAEHVLDTAGRHVTEAAADLVEIIAQN